MNSKRKRTILPWNNRKKIDGKLISEPISKTHFQDRMIQCEPVILSSRFRVNIWKMRLIKWASRNEIPKEHIGNAVFNPSFIAYIKARWIYGCHIKPIPLDYIVNWWKFLFDLCIRIYGVAFSLQCNLHGNWYKVCCLVETVTKWLKA